MKDYHLALPRQRRAGQGDLFLRRRFTNAEGSKEGLHPLKVDLQPCQGEVHGHNYTGLQQVYQPCRSGSRQRATATHWEEEDVLGFELLGHPVGERMGQVTQVADGESVGVNEVCGILFVVALCRISRNAADVEMLDSIFTRALNDLGLSRYVVVATVMGMGTAYRYYLGRWTTQGDAQRVGERVGEKGNVAATQPEAGMS